MMTTNEQFCARHELKTLLRGQNCKQRIIDIGEDINNLLDAMQCSQSVGGQNLGTVLRSLHGYGVTIKQTPVANAKSGYVAVLTDLSLEHQGRLEKLSAQLTVFLDSKEKVDMYLRDISKHALRVLLCES